MSLTAAERETVITMNDEDDFAIISTFQRPRLTALKKNPAAELIRDTTFQGTAGAVFKVPKKLVPNIRNARAPRALTNAEKERRVQAGKRLGKARAK